MTTDVHQGPLEAAPAITIDVHERRLDAVPAVTIDVEEDLLKAAPATTTPVRKTWREQRWERRRRRIWLEEALAWVLVPVILFGGYYLIDSALNALGTSPAAIIAGISTIASGL
jgi:hypothetical protein